MGYLRRLRINPKHVYIISLKLVNWTDDLPYTVKFTRGDRLDVNKARIKKKPETDGHAYNPLSKQWLVSKVVVQSPLLYGSYCRKRTSSIIEQQVRRPKKRSRGGTSLRHVVFKANPFNSRLFTRTPSADNVFPKWVTREVGDRMVSISPI